MFDCPPASSTEWQNAQLDISKKWTPGRRDNWAVYDLIDSISKNLVWMLKTPRLFALFAFDNGWIIYGRRSYSLCSRDFVRESIHHYDICRSPHVILINGENFTLPRDKLDRFIAVFFFRPSFYFAPFMSVWKSAVKLAHSALKLFRLSLLLLIFLLCLFTFYVW